MTAFVTSRPKQHVDYQSVLEWEQLVQEGYYFRDDFGAELLSDAANASVDYVKLLIQRLQAAAMNEWRGVADFA